MKKEYATGVLILGYDTKELNWEETVWGTPPDKAGRLVKAAAVILEEKTSIAIISGGAISNEAREMKNRLYRGLEQLKKFTVYPVLQEFSSKKIRRELDEVLQLEEEATNTKENIINTGEMFKESGAAKVIIVTSPDHISRGLRDALIYWSRDYPELAANVYGSPSVTFYSARTPEDQEIAKMENVVIFEPPAAKAFKLTRMFSVLKNQEALSEIDTVLKKYEKQSSL